MKKFKFKNTPIYPQIENFKISTFGLEGRIKELVENTNKIIDREALVFLKKIDNSVTDISEKTIKDLQSKKYSFLLEIQKDVANHDVLYSFKAYLSDYLMETHYFLIRELDFVQAKLRNNSMRKKTLKILHDKKLAKWAEKYFVGC